jgi:hypothetical protein
MIRPDEHNYTYNRGGSGEFISWMELSQAQDKYIDHLESRLAEIAEICEPLSDIWPVSKAINKINTLAKGG